MSLGVGLELPKASQHPSVLFASRLPFEMELPVLLPYLCSAVMDSSPLELVDLELTKSIRVVSNSGSHLPLLPKFWDYRYVPSCQALLVFLGDGVVLLVCI